MQINLIQAVMQVKSEYLQIKNTGWEGGVRGVAAIWSPLIKKRKRVSNQLMYMADWLPTLLPIAG